MKILFLIPQIPYPPDTGAKIRTFNHIRNLSLKHEIAVLGFAARKDVAEEFQNALPKVRVLAVRKADHWYDTLEYLTRALFSSKPYVVIKYLCPKMREILVKTWGEGGFDIIHVDHVHMAGYMEGLGENVNCYLDEHNVEYIIAERMRDRSKGWLRMFAGFEAKKMKRFEGRMLAKFRLVFAVSETDKETFASLDPTARIRVVPNGVNTQEFAFGHKEKLQNRIFFVGSMDWWPNQDAIHWFMREAWPHLEKTVPGISFNIIGRNFHHSLEPYRNFKNVGFHENVGDVRPFFYEGDVCIVPLRIGGGTRIKILESMSLGRPVVSTTVGAEGIAVRDGENILLADAPEDFSGKIKMLLENQDMYRRIAAQARKCVEEKYDWAASAAVLETAYGESK